MPRLSMKELQTSLGFDFPGGLSYKSHLAKIPVILQLLDGLARICERYAKLEIPEIQTSPDIRMESDTLLRELGPSLWPDIPEGGERPVWLLDPSHIPLFALREGRSYNSDAGLRFILLLRFREFVCARVSNYTNNARNRCKGGAHVPSASGSQQRSVHPSGPELGGSLESGTPNRNSNSEIDEDSIFENSGATPADLLINRIATSSPTSRSISTKGPPVALTVATSALMDNTQAKLDVSAAEPTFLDPTQIIDEHQSPSKNRPVHSGFHSSSTVGQLPNSGIAGSSVTMPSGQVIQPLDHPDDQQQTPAKRKTDIDTPGTGVKRTKCTPNAYNLKPSLIVKLPQIKKKGRLTTGPSSRPHIPFSEENEVVAGPSTLPFSTQSDSAATPEPERRQAGFQSQRSNDMVETANCDRVNIAVVSPPPSSTRANSALPQGKGKGRALPSPEPHANLSEANLKTIAQFRSEWPIGDDQISDELLLVALEIVSADALVAQILGEQHSPMPDPPSASAAQGQSLAIANTAKKEAVTIDLTASSDEEDNTPQTGSDLLFDKRSAKDRSTMAVSGSGRRQDLTMAKFSNSATDSNSQPATIEASQATALTENISRAHLDNILGRVVMLLRVKREYGTALPTIAITLEEIHTSEDFFRATQSEFQASLEPDEEFTRAHMRGAGGTLEGGFTLDRRSRRNIGWSVWLVQTRRIFESDPKGFQMSMTADIFVTKKSGTSY